MPASRATYVYGLVRSRERPSMRGVPRGLPAAGRPRLLHAGGWRWLVVADVPSARYGQAALAGRLGDVDWVSRCAVGHGAVVDRFLESPALVPMRLFTIFASDERALGYVRRERRRLDRALSRVAGCIEWGIRVRAESRRTADRSARPAGLSGTEYLTWKRRERAVQRDALRDGQRLAAALLRTAGQHAVDVKRQPLVVAGQPQGRVLLDCTCLVRRRTSARFRAAVDSVARTAAGKHFRVTLTGPWPPYNFVGEAA